MKMNGDHNYKQVNNYLNLSVFLTQIFCLASEDLE